MQNWDTVLQASFQSIWTGIANFIPELVLAVIIILIGWAVGGLLRRVVSQIIGAVKIDSALKAAKFDTVLNRAGFKLNSGEFIGGLVEWFVIVVALVAACDILGLTQVNEFLKEVVLLYLPQVIVAALILLVAAVIAETMQKIVTGAAQGAGVSASSFLGAAAKWAIWIFAVLVALGQLGIARPFVETLFMGVVFALAIGFGLAFGLGGQDAAARLIEKIRQEVASRR